MDLLEVLSITIDWKTKLGICAKYAYTMLTDGKLTEFLNFIRLDVDALTDIGEFDFRNPSFAQLFASIVEIDEDQIPADGVVQEESQQAKPAENESDMAQFKKYWQFAILGDGFTVLLKSVRACRRPPKWSKGFGKPTDRTYGTYTVTNCFFETTN